MTLITTFLEMRSPDQLRPKRSADNRLRIQECLAPNWTFNRDLYLEVGEMWQWIDKRSWTDEQWKEYATAPALRTFGAYHDDTLAGYYELRRDDEGGAEIAYFGLMPDFLNCGLGGALLTSAIEEAWRLSPPVNRVWVHTCTRDHPRALENYKARGLLIYEVKEE